MAATRQPASAAANRAGPVAEMDERLERNKNPDRPYPYRADDGREDPNLPGERIVRGGNYIFDDTPDKLVSWNRTVAFRNPATGHRQIGFRCAAD